MAVVLRFLLALLFLTFSLLSEAQFAPGNGESGSTAIYKDSSIFVAWASSCEVKRGFIDISDTNKTFTQGNITSNRVFFGEASLATGSPGGSVDVVSLGDSGEAILSFNQINIINGEGPDFAVFENGLSSTPGNSFLELAFVEVSTDGVKYVRFPSTSNTQTNTQIGTFETLKPVEIHNLAGKYLANYGTPFDLEDLVDSSGIDITNINFVKIIDVVGDVNSDKTSFDSQGTAINDPFPTPFWQGGFDLDAVGVINGNVVGLHDISAIDFQVFPNPVSEKSKLTIQSKQEIESVWLVDFSGNHLDLVRTSGANYDLKLIQSGVYVLQIQTDSGVFSEKLIVNP